MRDNIGVIGIGRLGLCWALNLEKKYKVIGCDVNENYVRSINERKLLSNEPGVNNLLKTSKNLVATTSLPDVIDQCDIIFVMVATPSLPNGKYDHSSIDRVVDEIISYIKKPLETPKYLIIGCTVMPQYCQNLYDKIAKYNIHLAYNPEFIAQGDIIRGQINPDIVLIGEIDSDIGEIVESIHKSIIVSKAKICRMNLVEAEIAKIALNCFCTIKISYANMIGDLAAQVNANPDVILNAIGQDSRIGNKYLRYGDGFGGVCFPRDNRALNIFANENNITLRLSEVVDDANRLHLDFQVKNIMENIHDEKFVMDSVTYKRGVDIIEESQRLKMAVILSQSGVKVTIRDSAVVIEKVKKIYGDLFTYEII